MITIACVLRSGGIYTAEWVRKLQAGAASHLSGHRFVCLSDVDVPCERIPLVTGWPGWWSKIEMFRPGLFAGRVLYLDLDSLIVGSLDGIAAYPHRFTAAHEFYRPELLCSTALAWEGDYSCIWQAMLADPQRIVSGYDRRGDKVQGTGRIGDQAFIEDVLAAEGLAFETFRDTCGRHSVASYKVDCNPAPPKGAAVVAFHGRPKMHEAGGWVAEAWGKL